MYCSNEGQILFEGANFANVPKVYKLSNDPPITFNQNSNSKTQLSGRIYYDTKTVPDGPYVIDPQLSRNKDDDWSGTIMLGDYYGYHFGQKYFNWTPPTDAYVTGQATDELYRNLNFTVYGKFNV